MYLSDTERLAVIAGCIGFLLLCFLIVACKLSPYCCLYDRCPWSVSPKLDQEYITSDSAKAKQYESTGQHEHFALTAPPVEQCPPSRENIHPDGADCYYLETERAAAFETSPPISVHKSKHSRNPSSDTQCSSDSGGDASSFMIKGEIQFSFSYQEHRRDASNNYLSVWVRKVSNLIIRRRDRVKLYVKVQLIKEESNTERLLKIFQFLDEEEQEENVEFEAHTSHKAIHKLLEWDSPIQIPLGKEGLENRCVRLVCCIQDAYSDFSQVGHVIVPLGDVPVSASHVIKRTLTATHQEGKGELLVSLSYLPTAQKLVVLPVEGRQLKMMQSKYSSYVYIRVSLTSRGTYSKKKTRHRETQSRIIWNEPMNFDLPTEQLGDVNVVISLKQCVEYPEGTMNIVVGKLVIGSEYGALKGQQQWQTMLVNPRKPVTEWHTLY